MRQVVEVALPVPLSSELVFFEELPTHPTDASRGQRLPVVR
jgi:hypothetical protein